MRFLLWERKTIALRRVRAEAEVRTSTRHSPRWNGWVRGLTRRMRGSRFHLRRADRLRALEHVASYAKCIGHSIDVVEPRGDEGDLKDPAIVEPPLSQAIVIRA